MSADDECATIRKITHERDFTIIGNATIRDGDLSFKATGLLTYLLSLPDDWEIRERELTTRKTDGRASVRSAMAELIEAGYVERRTEVRDGTPRCVTYVFETPDLRGSGNRTDDERGSESLTVGNPDSPDPAPEKKETGRGSTDLDDEAVIVDEVSPEIAALVSHLALKVRDHGGHAVKTKGWERDMRLLAERGPTEWAQPGPIPASEIMAMIDAVFAGARESSGFSWADQVRSAAALRRHWTKLETWRSRRGGRPRGADAVAAASAMFEEAGVAPGALLGLTTTGGE